MDPLSLTPIGIFHSSKTKNYQAARQAAAASTLATTDYIELFAESNFEQALEGLENFSHLWVIYIFHQNTNWKPKISPPRGTSKKVGVFATRSPHRPNPIGISALPLSFIRGRKIYVKNNDLLNNTPILDIKPYLAYADSIPSANEGWLEFDKTKRFKIVFSDLFKKQISFFNTEFSELLSAFLTQQLEYEPLNKKKKRVKQLPEGTAVISYQTWRVYFSIHEQLIVVQSLHSGYSADEICDANDPYQDKALHRQFIQTFTS